MKNEDEGVSVLEWINNSKHPNLKLFGISVAVFLFGYFVGEYRTTNKWQALLANIIRTNTIHIGSEDIGLGMSQDKRIRILEAMEEAIIERESERDFERQADRMSAEP